MISLLLGLILIKPIMNFIKVFDASTLDDEVLTKSKSDY